MLDRKAAAGGALASSSVSGPASPGLLADVRSKLARMGYSDGAQLLRSHFPELVAEADAEAAEPEQEEALEGAELPALEADGEAMASMHAAAAAAPRLAPRAAQSPLETVADAAESAEAAEDAGATGPGTEEPRHGTLDAELSSLSTALHVMDAAPEGVHEDAAEELAQAPAAGQTSAPHAAQASAAPDASIGAAAAKAVEAAPPGALEAATQHAPAEAPAGVEPDSSPLESSGGSPEAALQSAAQETVSTAESPVVRSAKRTLGERMGADVAAVPVHLESPVAEEADAQGIARDGAVHLSLGEDALATTEGQEVLAHELVHVEQGRAQGPEQPEARNEEEADHLARTLVRGKAKRPSMRAPRRRTLHKKGKAAAKAPAVGKSPRDKKLLSIMKKHGIVHRGVVLAEARRANIPLSLACSMLVQESGGGHNVFGHDAVKPGQVVGGDVTKKKYKHYKKLRKAGYGMQGVGPMQLTWYTLQDKADEMGGCWKPKWNLRVGFQHLRSLIDAQGKFSGVRSYNGSGSAATTYAHTVLGRQKQFQKWFKTAKGLPNQPPKPAGGPSTGGIKAPQAPGAAKPESDDRDLTKKQLRKALRYNRRHNKTKFEIRRIQEAVHVARTGKLDAATVQAIADFQDKTNLDFDGMVGPHTWKRIKLHLRRSHGLTKGHPLTNLERKEAVRYNKKRKLRKKSIRKFQKFLGVSPDGVIGPKTSEAVAKFQRKRGLPAHGWLTPYTVKVLKKWLKKKKTGKAGWPGHGASNSAKLKWAMKRAKQIGLWITSTTGGQHAPGSYHYSGRAFDCAGSPSLMEKFYKATRWTNPTELFYDPMGGVKHGQDIGAIGDHTDHVHIAY